MSDVNENRFVEAVERLADEIYKLRWYVGAIASQMQTQTRMMASDRGIEVIWHDPSVEPWSMAHPQVVHGTDASLSEGDKILTGIPPEKRQEPPFDV